MWALNVSDGAKGDSPWGKDLLPSTRFTQEKERTFFLGLAQWGESQEQFLYQNVLIAVTMGMIENLVVVSESAQSH